MRFEVCILTAPRPAPTFYRTLHSLRETGFDMPFVCDGAPVGNDEGVKQNGRAYLTILYRMATLYKDWDMLLVVDDDTVFCKGVCEYLQHVEFPELNKSVYSLYVPSVYSKVHSHSKTWWPEDRGYFLAGGIAFLYPRVAVERILNDLTLDKIQWGFDRELGTWARANKFTVWHHEPSLAQHTGMDDSSLTGGDGKSCYGNDIGLASTFVGEDKFIGG